MPWSFAITCSAVASVASASLDPRLNSSPLHTHTHLQIARHAPYSSLRRYALRQQPVAQAVARTNLTNVF